MYTFVFITGGVLSSLGKGIAAGGIGALLEGMGYSVNFLKLDPYLNVDPGTMNPYQHGEVFVTDDGAETDLDLGHYERFTNAVLSKRNSATSGKLYAQLLEKERSGAFLGATVQVVPHFTQEIKDFIYQAGQGADITIVEIGGTVGDIEGLPFLETIRQMGLQRSNVRCAFVHLTYIPYIAVAEELKTKPTQHSVKELQSLGIQPHIVIGRASIPLPVDIKKKISLFTNVEEDSVISAPDLPSIYEVPLHFKQERVDEVLLRHLGLPYQEPNLEKWKNLLASLSSLEASVTIALVGKHVLLPDAYKSVCESLIHAQIPTKTKVHIKWVNAEEVTENNVSDYLAGVQGILVPGGFGERGIEGKILAARYAREHKIPYFGICLGMQVAVVEFARNVLNMAEAHSTEVNPLTPFPVVDLMVEQKDVQKKGGTMRLGAYLCALKENSKVSDLYQAPYVSERHRHRYEFNPLYASRFEEAGMLITGVYQAHNLPEIIELNDHPYFVACQFHPELKSKPFAPHPLFVGFVKAALENK